MSLQVWLPLNGNLDNQGLSEVTVTNNGATVDSNGKIGSCYLFNGNSYIQFPSITVPNDFSISIWGKWKAFNNTFHHFLQRRRRDLNPRAAQTTYTLSRGTSSAT